MTNLPFAPSFDIVDRSMKCVPITSSDTESLKTNKSRPIKYTNTQNTFPLT